MERWEGRVAIVTGAGSGIGEAYARILVENGLKVVAADLNTDYLETIVGELSECKGELHPIQCDVTIEDDVVRVVKWTRENLGGADVLVNNAGIAPIFPLTDFATETVKKLLDVNVLGLCVFSREVIADMTDRGVDDGHIFHMCSIAGQGIPVFPGSYVYSATKNAVRVLTEGLRRELRDMGSKIRVTSISPGIVRTNIFVAGGFTQEQSDQLFEEHSNLEPRDIAEALVFALSRPQRVQVHNITIQPQGEKI